MKPKNFPARKLRRQFLAKGIDINSPEIQVKLENARGRITKKRRDKK